MAKTAINKIIDGKLIASKITDEIKKELSLHNNIKPGLALILVGITLQARYMLR